MRTPNRILRQFKYREDRGSLANATLNTDAGDILYNVKHGYQDHTNECADTCVRMLRATELDGQAVVQDAPKKSGRHFWQGLDDDGIFDQLAAQDGAHEVQAISPLDIATVYQNLVENPGVNTAVILKHLAQNTDGSLSALDLKVMAAYENYEDKINPGNDFQMTEALLRETLETHGPFIASNKLDALHGADHSVLVVGIVTENGEPSLVYNDPWKGPNQTIPVRDYLKVHGKDSIVFLENNNTVPKVDASDVATHRPQSLYDNPDMDNQEEKAYIQEAEARITRTSASRILEQDRIPYFEKSGPDFKKKRRKPRSKNRVRALDDLLQEFQQDTKGPGAIAEQEPFTKDNFEKLMATEWVDKLLEEIDEQQRQVIDEKVRAINENFDQIAQGQLDVDEAEQVALNDLSEAHDEMPALDASDEQQAELSHSASSDALDIPWQEPKEIDLDQLMADEQAAADAAPPPPDDAAPMPEEQAEVKSEAALDQAAADAAPAAPDDPAPRPEQQVNTVEVNEAQEQTKPGFRDRFRAKFNHVREKSEKSDNAEMKLSDYLQSDQAKDQWSSAKSAFMDRVPEGSQLRTDVMQSISQFENTGNMQEFTRSLSHAINRHVDVCNRDDVDAGPDKRAVSSLMHKAGNITRDFQTSGPEASEPQANNRVPVRR